MAHTWHSTLQDKYMADMDELFSQVDEKRKVRPPGNSWQVLVGDSFPVPDIFPLVL